MHQERSYVIGLENVSRMNNYYYGIDRDGLSFRYAGKYMLLGGAGHRTGNTEEKKDTANCADMLRFSGRKAVLFFNGLPRTV